MKLIDKDALVAEIERIMAEEMSFFKDCYEDELENTSSPAVYTRMEMLLSFLDTLEVKEVDLEKEFFNWYHKESTNDYNASTLYERYSTISKKLAKHFFELGLNSQTKDMTEALRMEYEKGRADVLRVIDPDVMVADFCSQPLSKTRSLASIYRQGIIDILKRINNNEKTSITGTHSVDDGGVR